MYSHKEHQDLYNESNRAMRVAHKKGIDLEQAFHYFHNLIMDIACYKQVDDDASAPYEQFNDILND